MTDREKVIKGLEDIREDYENMRCKVSMAIIDDAIALLKAQEPRVMTLEEVQSSNEALTLEKRRTVCYGLELVLHVAELDYAEPPVEKFGIAGYEETIAFRDDEYGKTWRCWTSRPTDEQREAVKWND